MSRFLDRRVVSAAVLGLSVLLEALPAPGQVIGQDLSKCHPDEREAVAVLTKAKFTLWPGEDGRITRAQVSGSKTFTDKEMALLARLPELFSLEVRECPITDAGLQSLTPLRKLRTVDLAGVNVGDEGMAASQAGRG